jgi:DNA invertase Pin-like site-specific DNA recombinase
MIPENNEAPIGVSQTHVMIQSEKKTDIRLLAYCRVSTTKQKNKDTIQNQHRSIERFCASRGAMVLKWYDEQELSGASADRPKFKQLRSDILNKKYSANGIIVYDVSRLVRDEDLGEDVMRELRDNDIKLWQSLTGTSLDLHDANQRLMFKFFNWIASDERTRILARQREGIERARENKTHLGRKFKKIDWKMYDEMHEAKICDAAIARMLGIGRMTLYRRLSERSDGYPDGKPK